MKSKFIQNLYRRIRNSFSGDVEVSLAPPLFFKKFRERYHLILRTPPIFLRVSLGLFTVGVVIVMVRFIFGLGPVTNMSDGYPWGIWIAFDVIVGTALGTGGFLMAILIYLLNKWEYHPLIRSAVLTAGFGYTIAGISVIIDLGRWWNFYELLLPWRWNPTSVLLEVALCIMGYTLVVWIEFSPVLVEKAQSLSLPAGSRINRLVANITSRRNTWNKLLIAVISLGILLPIMHQSSLGNVMAIAPTKLHPLWFSPFLPLMFLVSVVFMGYSMVVAESFAASFFLDNPYETSMLRKLLPFIAFMAICWLTLRFLTLTYEGNLGYILKRDNFSLFFVLEIVAAVVGIFMIMAKNFRRKPRYIYIGAVALLIAGTMYRMNVYLIGYTPISGYLYMPSVWEVLGTFGFIATEMLLYIVFIKYLPVVPDYSNKEFRPEPDGG